MVRFLASDDLTRSCLLGDVILEVLIHFALLTLAL
jgi:hypothetical protein